LPSNDWQENPCQPSNVKEEQRSQTELSPSRQKKGTHEEKSQSNEDKKLERKPFVKRNYPNSPK
ncbi:MAG: hypothetical protein O3C21_08015, partial [Verrucomicrobia bacterium]|nr:hypothetical protein [Verrucomicrobiota bacterium]